jgi:hypothetical protein
MNVRFGPGQTNGLGIGDEMNLVAPAGELKPQFRGDDSAAAVSWITGYANLHAPPDASLTIPSLDSREGLAMQGKSTGISEKFQTADDCGNPTLQETKDGNLAYSRLRACFIQLTLAPLHDRCARCIVSRA